jgi:1,4-dihydroxy-6-naphthoate synthase
MSEQVMRQHIDLYVNEYSLDLGEKGKKAILKLLENHPIQSLGDLKNRKDIFVAL